MTAQILVVDDEPDLEPLILQKLRKRIRSGEVEFRFAHNGEEALEQLQAHPEIDIVLSDINMPVMDGLTLLSRIAELNRLRKTVIVSAYDDLQNIRTAMNRGAFDFLTKPIDFEDLNATLNKTIGEVDEIRRSLVHRDQLVALHNELKVASKIQQAILPREPLIDPRFEVAGRMLPARVVSGDFFDFFKLDSSRVAVAIGDVAGKGVPAAIYMAVSQTMLRATALQESRPGACLRGVNEGLLRQSEGELFVTMLFAVIDAGTGALEFAVAGHAPPWLLSNGRVERLDLARGTMLGIFKNPEIGVARVTLEPGDTLFFATDGVFDAENPAGEAFGTDSVGHALETAVALDPPNPAPQQLVDRVLETVIAFSAGTQQNDDITALAVRLAQHRLP